MTKKDRAALIKSLNTALTLYVLPENRKAFVEQIAYDLQLDFVNHFVEACLSN